MSYIIPKDELTLTDMKAFREMAINAGIARAVALKIASTPKELVVRSFENIFDAGQAAANDFWQTAALAVVGTAYSCFGAVAAPTLAPNKLAVFYKVGIETVPIPVSLLTFRSGGALGNITSEFDLEQLINGWVTEGYFSEVQVIDPQRQFAVQVTCRIATGALARIQLGAFIIEPIGQRIA